MKERSPRFSSKLQIVYDDGNAFMSGSVADISETGVFLETVMPLEPGTRVRLTPLLPEKTGIFEIAGIVVRKAEYSNDAALEKTPGMGIKFVDVTDEMRAQLRRVFDAESAL